MLRNKIASAVPVVLPSKTPAMISGGLFGVALVAGGVGAYLYVSGGKKRQEQGVFVRTVPERHGLGARVGTSF